MTEGKLIICSAPSGAGKSTIVGHLLSHVGGLSFSVSATNRAPRGNEKDGREYHFITTRAFREGIAAGDFLEYEEVYPGRFYGTLRGEVERMLGEGRHVIFDVDVAGGCRIKSCFGDRALSVFISPPSIEDLRDRLVRRGTETAGAIESRLSKAGYEMSFAPRFDTVIVNDDLDIALGEALETVERFIGR
ncbi:MAG: guanylate kinase [Tannerellaceae bacterium]|nr:guanylate kinase [Tannerellaceae bacterium]